MAKKIIPLIPEHTCYCEVFAGAAWILFKKEESKVEIINDINTDLVTLYRVVKNHLDEFVRYLRWILVAREEFERFKAENPETLTDIQRAVRFYFLLKTGYGGRVPNPTFSLSSTQRSSLNLLRIEEELSAIHLRLARVYIENMSFEKLIERVDKPSVFFYIDPPYFGYEDCYGKGIFTKADFERLKDILSNIEGKFIMSLNDTPEVRSLYEQFIIRHVNTSYILRGAQNRKQAGELLIMNYQPAA